MILVPEKMKTKKAAKLLKTIQKMNTLTNELDSLMVDYLQTKTRYGNSTIENNVCNTLHKLIDGVTDLYSIIPILMEENPEIF